MTIKITGKIGRVVAVRQVSNIDEFMLITSLGKIIRLRSSDVSIIGRATQGVKLVNLQEEERVVSFAKVVIEESEKI